LNRGQPNLDRFKFW
ncbi:DUF645 family protein, partial [Vibrio cholerae]|nr:DUF645 family protein [Vibrio cholerae]MBI0289266.1 DUF645 family protein [Vibrio cholerae]MCX9613761.1 DUF645 family protein [Vibrio cholerae]HAS3667644.1 DUF645 family protein [Vibrio cholerae]HAS5208311.1 DUF645 family protein [Vibrio cholerae]